MTKSNISLKNIPKMVLKML